MSTIKKLHHWLLQRYETTVVAISNAFALQMLWLWKEFLFIWKFQQYIGSIVETATTFVFMTTLIVDLGSSSSLVTLLRLWTRRFTMIISAWLLWTTSKFSGQEFEESIGTLGYWKLLSRFGFLQARSSYHNEKCADRSTVGVRRCPVAEE